jgi:hypothetical protein
MFVSIINRTPGTTLEFQIRGKAGAGLLTKNHTYSQFAVQLSRYKELMVRHCQSWHRFAASEGYDVKLQDIILVTGVSLTQDWAMFAYNSRVEREASIKFQVAGMGSSTSAGVWGRWFSEQSIHENHGPIQIKSQNESGLGPFPLTSTETTSTPRLAANSEAFTENNQCVFIKYYQVRFPRVPQFLMKAAAGPHNPNFGEDPDEGGYANPLHVDDDFISEQDLLVKEELSDDQGILILEAYITPGLESKLIPAFRKLWETNSSYIQ